MTLCILINWKSTLNILNWKYFYHVTAQLHLKSKRLLRCWLHVCLSLLPILSRSFHAGSDRWRVCWPGAWWPVRCRGWFNLRNKLKNNEKSQKSNSPHRKPCISFKVSSKNCVVHQENINNMMIFLSAIGMKSRYCREKIDADQGRLRLTWGCGTTAGLKVGCKAGLGSSSLSLSLPSCTWTQRVKEQQTFTPQEFYAKRRACPRKVRDFCTIQPCHQTISGTEIQLRWAVTVDMQLKTGLQPIKELTITKSALT